MLCYKLVQHTRFECLRERTLSLLEVLINIDFLDKVCVKIYKHYYRDPFSSNIASPCAKFRCNDLDPKVRRQRCCLLEQVHTRCRPAGCTQTEKTYPGTSVFWLPWNEKERIKVWLAKLRLVHPPAKTARIMSSAFWGQICRGGRKMFVPREVKPNIVFCYIMLKPVSLVRSWQAIKNTFWIFEKYFVGVKLWNF